MTKTTGDRICQALQRGALPKQPGALGDLLVLPRHHREFTWKLPPVSPRELARLGRVFWTPEQWGEN